MGLRSGDWLGPSITYMFFFFSHSSVALPYVKAYYPARRPLHDPCSVSWLREGGYRPRFSWYMSCPLSRETPPKHNVSTSMLDGGDGVLGL